MHIEKQEMRCLLMISSWLRRYAPDKVEVKGILNCKPIYLTLPFPLFVFDSFCPPCLGVGLDLSWNRGMVLCGWCTTPCCAPSEPSVRQSNGRSSMFWSSLSCMLRDSLWIQMLWVFCRAKSWFKQCERYNTGSLLLNKCCLLFIKTEKNVQYCLLVWFPHWCWGFDSLDFLFLFLSFTAHWRDKLTQLRSKRNWT